MTVQRNDAYHTEVTCVTFGSFLHVVNLEDKKCTCRHFEHEKLPCVHAIAAAEYMNVCRISMCSPYYNSGYIWRHIC